MPRVLLSIVAVTCAGSFVPVAIAGEDEHPLPKAQRDKMTRQFEERVATLTGQIEKQPDSVPLYSQRADALFFLGRFRKAVADYEKMVKLDADLDASHWRRGIAWFYDGKYKKAAHQFEIYNSFDDVDRENGIWRFFSQARAYGLKRAAEGLLKYKKDDREPFPAVYQLFAGKTTPEKILAEIKAAKISDTEREKRFFYAELYIGLNHAIHNRPAKARPHLRKAVANKWGPAGGYGPHYMWEVGRLHYELLRAEKKKPVKRKSTSD